MTIGMHHNLVIIQQRHQDRVIGTQVVNPHRRIGQYHAGSLRLREAA